MGTQIVYVTNAVNKDNDINILFQYSASPLSKLSVWEALS